MQVAARIGAWSGKPLPYLRRVEYLQSSGSQYLDIGLLNKNDLLSVDASYDGVIGVRAFMLGCGSGVSQYLEITVNGKWGTQRTGTVNCVSGQRVNIDIKESFIKIDGEVTYQLNNILGGANPLLIFKTFGYGKPCKGRLWGFSLNNNIAIPVLDLSGRPAMYDEVSGQFFYNQGTGEFTWGELT